MRTLKKTLCLVLVLAMVMGFGVTANAAYVDADKITYTEAVDVLSALKVLEGDENGFRPTDTLTRAEACAIIARLLQDEDIAVGAPAFKDVKATDWFAGYVNYCYNAGIVDGYGNGKFGPNDKLTGYAWAKMLLTALGCDAKAEGMTGDTWQIGVAKLAKANDLFVGNLNADKTANCTREEAALYALNMMKAKEVKWTDGVTTTVGGVTVTTGGTRTQATNDEFYKTFETLTLNALASTDAFGRPANNWSYKGKAVGSYPATPVLTYTTAITGGQLYTDLGKVTPDTLTRVVNGRGADNLASKVVSGNKDSFGGNGTLIEIFKISATEYKAVATQTFLGEITGWTPAVKDANGDITAKEYVTVKATVGGYDYTDTFETTAFTQADATNATKVLLTAVTADGITYDVKTVKAATSATVTATWQNATSFVAGGTTYKYSENYNAIIASSDVTGKVAKTVYFDDYGYVIYVTAPAASTPNYAYVLDARTIATGWSTGDTFEAKLLYTDGTVKTVVVSESAATLTGKVVTYKDGTGAAAGKIVLEDASAWTKADAKLEKNKASQFGDIYNDKTIVVIETTAADKVTKVYNAYTGITNIPTATGDVNSIVSSGVAKVTFLMDATLEAAPVTAKDVVYVYADSAKAATDVTKGAYKVYNAVVNGTITTVEATSAASLSGFYGALTSNEKGLVTTGTSLSGDKIAMVSKTGTAVAKDGVIALGGTSYIYDANTTVYVANPATGALTASSISAIKADATDYVAGYTTNGILTMIVIETLAD